MKKSPRHQNLQIDENLYKEIFKISLKLLLIGKSSPDLITTTTTKKKQDMNRENVQVRGSKDPRALALNVTKVMQTIIKSNQRNQIQMNQVCYYLRKQL